MTDAHRSASSPVGKTARTCSPLGLLFSTFLTTDSLSTKMQTR